MVWVDFAGIASSTSAAMTFAAMAGAFHGFAHWAAPAAVDGLWQGAVVALGLAVCLGLMPRVSASHRFAAWAAGFAVAAGLPALPWLARLLGGLAERLLARVAGVTGAAAQAASTAGAAHAWRQIDARWSLAIGGLWLAISAYRATGLALHTVRLRRLWKSARPVQDGFASLAAHSEMRGVKVCATSELDRPGVIGFFAPRILVPEWLLERLTRDELEQVILHETEHLRRWDDWTNLGQKVCLMLFPLNPALAWMERRLAKEREMACDEGVVRVTRAPRAYAACLASLAERRLENNRLGSHLARAEALSLGAFERRPELVHRVHSILFGGKMLSPVASRALVGMVGCGLVLGSVELARCPQVVAFVPEQRTTATTAATGMTAALAEVPGQAQPLRALRADDAVARPDEGYRATDAEAMMPAAGTAVVSRPTMEMRPETSRETRPETRSTALAALPRAVKPIADAPAAARASLVKATVSAQAAAQPQEWLVVTTWQVQTSYRAQNVADYDTTQDNSGDAKPAAASALQSPGKNSVAENTAADAGTSMSAGASVAQGRPENEIAVTRMFLSVYRATGKTGTAARTAATKTARRLTATNTDWTTAQNPAANGPTKPATKRQFRAVPFGDGWLVIEL
jgi:beta-lactamase regulating signal transducer with metallopeptidase domain